MPYWHPTRTNFCVRAENADMHLTLGFLGSNTHFGSPWLLIFDEKTMKKPLRKRLPLGAALFFNVLWIRCHLKRQHDTQDLAKTAPTTLKRPPKTRSRALTDQPRTMQSSIQRAPRASQTTKNLKNLENDPKSRWGTHLGLAFGANMARNRTDVSKDLPKSTARSPEIVFKSI